MNRKISTLFTAGLLMAGSLCGSAWAQSSIQQLAGFVNGQGTFTAQRTRHQQTRRKQCRNLSVHKSKI